MDLFELREIEQRRESSGKRYLEFLRTDSLSTGIYHLPAGAEDQQSPHREDEVYYAVRGKAAIRVGGEDRPIEPGSVVFVPRLVPHFFHSITEDLELLVFFAPAESG